MAFHEEPAETHRGKHDFTGDFTHEVIGAYYTVFNTLPRGLLEAVYSGALFAELTRLRLPVTREVPLRVHYRGDRLVPG